MQTPIQSSNTRFACYQELLYAKCISEEEYHSSKRPLLRRLAAQGAQIEARDVIVAGPKDSKENSEEEWSVILMEESGPPEPVKESNGLDKLKRKPFRTLFHKEQSGCPEQDQRSGKSGKKQWGFEGFKKWRRNESEDETAPLPRNEKSDSEAYSGSLAKALGEGPHTKLIKKKLHSDGSPSDFFIDKVLDPPSLLIYESHFLIELILDMLNNFFLHHK